MIKLAYHQRQGDRIHVWSPFYYAGSLKEIPEQLLGMCDGFACSLPEFHHFLRKCTS
jgi:hypothetical protein